MVLGALFHAGVAQARDVGQARGILDVDFWRDNLGLLRLVILVGAAVVVVVWTGLHKLRALRAREDDASRGVMTYSIDDADPARPIGLQVMEHLKEKHDLQPLDCEHCEGEGCKRCDDGGFTLTWNQAPCGAGCPLGGGEP
ncbi:hypothetical protein MYSTI_05974 [Myxococcus stipitatus DSM 14675]|uniref:Uncharacterized protein n=1 Tax=Myxococcus stipitatus (strain DSM 14675 / JCM 12634 / Mx s8) TaxID=1278073 RepID=L7UI59_MYXSD|nr:hypothetical protein [Myxococcus stipitatus]AGC47247.1 hypothetical protein MYSTI_05974 [Myxococcus stipitatus DSM 14675]